MTMESHGQPISMTAFKRLCKCYKAQKKWLQENLRSSAMWDGLDEAKVFDMRYRLFARNVELVESVFARLEKAHGSQARRAVWQLYVECEKQADVAQQQGFSLRTFQRNVAQWVEESLGGVYA